MNDLDKVLAWYENLTEASLKKMDSFYAHDSFFKDPFNEVQGIDKIKHIFDDMFKNLKNPRFIFVDKIQEGRQAFTTWDFVFIANGKSYKIHGSSHLKLNDEGKVIYHRDYWDVGEELLLKLPILKGLYGMLRKKLGSA